MKKIIVLLVLVMMACNSNRPDGIYQAETGWDIVEDGKTYQYRCDIDGLYLYIDWDGSDSYRVDFISNDNRTTSVRLQFLCKNKDGKYVYVANYSDIDAYDVKEIGFDIGNGREVIHQYKQNKDCFSLLIKYLSR